MRPLSDLSIRQKLMRVAMLASSLALLFAAAAFIVYDVVAFRSAVVRRLSTEAEIIAANTASPLLFHDASAATKTLAGLDADPRVRAAAIYGADGRLFAKFIDVDAGPSTLPPPPLSDPSRAEFRGRTVLVSRPIGFDGRTLGTVVLEGSLEELYTRLVRYVSLVALVSAISFLLSLGLSAGMQSAISGPILGLAETARRVSRDKDY